MGRHRERPKACTNSKPRRIYQEESVPWRESGLKVAGDQTSARQQSRYVSTLSAQSFTEIDVGRLVRLMLSPPTQHIEKGVAGWNGDRWMSDHRMLNPSGIRRRSRDAAVNLFGRRLENPKSDGIFRPAFPYEVSLRPRGDIA